MLRLRRTLESTLVPLAALVIVVSPPPLVSADDAPAAASPRSESHTKDLEEIRSILRTEEAARRLAEAGLTLEGTMARVEKMTQAEAHYLAQRLREERQAGGDALGVLVAILIIVLLVVLIILLLDKRIEIKDRESHPSKDVKSSQSAPKGAVLD
jgi:hypothetical protein